LRSSNFSSYLTDHERNCIIRDGTPSEVPTELYRYHSEISTDMAYTFRISILELKLLLADVASHQCTFYK
jgi:hypothetical protein